MLLGNCISGVALAVNTLTTSFVEQTDEIDLLLALGATPLEASLRLVRESIRVGATPMLNSMAVIGLVSIPGMMTGQILAGSPVVEAARYQMLICYLIALTAFGTIICEVWIVQRVAFDRSTQMLREGYFWRQKRSVYARILQRIVACVLCENRHEEDASRHGSVEAGSYLERASFVQSQITETEYGATDDDTKSSFIKLITLATSQFKTEASKKIPLLEIRSLSRTLKAGGGIMKEDDALFSGISHTIEPGTIVAVRGPSGAGKSQLLRVIARLVPSTEGELLLEGRTFPVATEWRQQVRYVSQTKVDIPGTPRELIAQIPRFKFWKRQQQTTPDTIYASVLNFVNQFGMDSTCLNQEWKTLSGGESQRVHLAIALASNPKVLLMDESTSALDIQSKLSVEQTVVRLAEDSGMGVLWITHDEDQIERLRG